MNIYALRYIFDSIDAFHCKKKTHMIAKGTCMYACISICNTYACVFVKSYMMPMCIHTVCVDANKSISIHAYQFCRCTYTYMCICMSTYAYKYVWAILYVHNVCTYFLF